MNPMHHSPRRRRSNDETQSFADAVHRAWGRTPPAGPARRKWRAVLCVPCTLLFLPLAQGQDETSAEGPSDPSPYVTNFRLTDHQGVSHQLYTHFDAKALVLIFDDTLSPEVESLIPEIGSLQAEFGSKGVVFWIINTAETVDRPALVSKAGSLGLSLPMLHDWAGYVVKELGAKRISEAVIISAETWTVVYQGLVARGARGQLERPLAEALAEFLRGDPITNAVVVADGPLIESTGNIDPNDPTNKHISYSKDIAPLLIAKCIACHSKGNIAPFEMTDYQTVLDWAPSFKEEVMAQRMPPWYADRAYGDFSNDRALSTEETATLLQWINDGALKDVDEEDPIATHLVDQPPQPGYPFAWPASLGQPNLILTIPTQSIPASGLVDYRYETVSTGLTSDKWLKAAVVLPGNPKVVHHCLSFLDSLDGDNSALTGNYAFFVPGSQGLAYPEGTAKFLPRDSNIIFQMHYISTGQPEEDQTQLGLYFRETSPAVELTTDAAVNFLFAIPPHASDHELTASITFDQETWLYDVSPHMHFRGSRMRFEAHYPDGTQEILASVPKYWFDWQIPLRFREPLLLPKGTRIRCTGAFDNSAGNIDNPNPNQVVFWGDQTHEEMFIGYLNTGIERPSLGSGRR